MADSETYTYYFGIDEFEDMPLPSKEELEAYAETFDFTVAPQRVSQEDIQAAVDRREEADAASYNYYWGFRIDMTTHAWYPPEGYSDSFDAYVTYIREYAAAEDQYYILLDLDGDGTEEMLWGPENGELCEVAYMVDGEVNLRFDDYLCEGNILMCELNHDTYRHNGEEREENRCTSYQYNTLSELIVKLYYLPTADQWIEVRPGQEDRVITEAEAKEIMAQFVILDLEMKPLSEYPLG